MAFVFEFESADGVWEPVGVGNGAGEDALQEAFTDLEEQSSGSLPPGRYRCRADNGTLREFEVDPSGHLSLA